jgi:dCTP deaminase
MVLGDLSLWKLLNDLVGEPDPDLVNPASIDIRVGPEMRLEVGPGEFRAVDLARGAVQLEPGAFALARTFECLTVPNGYAAELTLQPAPAAQGYGFATTVWLEPGWRGTATLPIRNATRYTPLPLACGMSLARLVVHPLDQPAVRLRRRQGPEARLEARATEVLPGAREDRP